jgi:hypothetical protein
VKRKSSGMRLGGEGGWLIFATQQFTSISLSRHHEQQHCHAKGTNLSLKTAASLLKSDSMKHKLLVHHTFYQKSDQHCLDPFMLQ